MSPTHDVINTKLDTITSNLATAILDQWTLDFDSDESHSKYIEDIGDDVIEFEIIAGATFDGSGITIQRSNAYSGGFNDEDEWESPLINFEFTIEKDLLPNNWSIIYNELLNTIRHEIEHLIQKGGNEHMHRARDINNEQAIRHFVEMGWISNEIYFTLPTEVDANLQGLKLKAKESKKSFIDTITTHLKGANVDDNHINYVVDVWRERAKIIGGIPEF